MELCACAHAPVRPIADVIAAADKSGDSRVSLYELRGSIASS